MLICSVVGARPNYMKVAPIVHALEERGIPQILVHTGQHYDRNMSQVFFDELGLPEPDTYLNVGSGTHARQTAQVMIGFETVCEEKRPDLIVVAGDVNSTMAAALVGAKLRIPVAHVEAGLRSFDREMPEEINRIVTDHVSDLLLTTEESGAENLQREGVGQDRIRFVGNCMVDTLLKHRQAALDREPWRQYGLEPGRYALVTLHRPSNVDQPDRLAGIVTALNGLAETVPVLFPIHPRTRSRMENAGLQFCPGVQTAEPLPYLEFVGLMARARLVLTDSGGIQEETTALGVPCLTLRENTERPITVTVGTNRLIGSDPAAIRSEAADLLSAGPRPHEVPPLWDGHAGERVVDAITAWLGDLHGSSAHGRPSKERGA